MAQSNSTLFPVPINTGKIPQEGPCAVPISYDFSAGVTTYTTDMTQIHAQGKITTVQSVFVDNSLNNGIVTVSASGLAQQISVAAGGQGVFPILVGGQTVFTITTLGSISAKISFVNVALPGFQWSSTPVPTTISGTVPVADAILDATVAAGRQNVQMIPAPCVDTDRSGTITAGGVAQVLMAPNATRRGWMIQNIDEVNLEELRYSTTGTATVATAGSFVIGAASGAGYPGGFAQGTGTGAISIIGATTGHKFTAIEW
jgi:hypothetical protein